MKPNPTLVAMTMILLAGSAASNFWAAPGASAFAQQSNPKPKDVDPKDEKPQGVPDAAPDSTQPAQPPQPRQRQRPQQPPATTPGTPATPAPGQPNPGQPAAAPATPAGKPAVTSLPVVDGPYIKRDRSKTWTFNARVEVLASRVDEIITDPRGGSTTMPRRDTWNYKTLAVVFPFIPKTASSDAMVRTLTGKMRVNDKAVVNSINPQSDIIESGHSGTQLIKFQHTDGSAKSVDFEVSYNVTSYRVTFDEAAAMKLGWPKGGWPAPAASTFEPQMFINYAPDINNGGNLAPFETETLTNAVNGWLRAANIRDPQSVPPVRVAKAIAGGVWRDLQPSGTGLSFNRQSQLEGITLKPVPTTLKDKRGTDFDILCVLVAAYRHVGLPTRLVLGWKNESRNDDKFLKKSSSGRSELRGWIEFGIFDENFKPDQGAFNWVPVDLIAARKSSNRPPDIEREWRFFGTINDLDGTVPFAFHFHPPTTVRAYGSPGFWGWMMTPENPPRARQNLMFSANTAAVRSTDKPNEDDSKTKRGRP
jgi:hypothetical protein